MARNFRMFNHVDYDDIIDDLYQNQLKTLCCVSFLYMLLRGLTYRSLLHSYFALIIFSFIQEYGLSCIKNDIKYRFNKLFHKFITNKTLDEDDVEEEDSVEEDSVEEDSVEEVAKDEDVKDEVAKDEDVKDEVAVEEDVKDEVAVEEVIKDEDAVEEVIKDEVVKDEVTVEEVDKEGSYNLRKRQILRDC